MRLDFSKFTSTCSPLELFPALGEEESWLLPSCPEGVKADELRRYVLLMFSSSKKNPCREITDLGKRRDKALQLAGVTRRLWQTDGWQRVLNFEAESMAEMVRVLMMRERNRLYEMWLSNLIAFSMMNQELREGIGAGTEADKKTLAFERKLKISTGIKKMEAEISDMEQKLFEGDETVTAAVTALGQRESERKGGWAERYAT